MGMPRSHSHCPGLQKLPLHTALTPAVLLGAAGAHVAAGLPFPKWLNHAPIFTQLLGLFFLPVVLLIGLYARFNLCQLPRQL